MHIVLDHEKANFIINNVKNREWKTFLGMSVLAGEAQSGSATMREMQAASGLTALSISKAIPRLESFGMIAFSWDVHHGSNARFSFIVNDDWANK